jgi:phospholipid-binding lipoprotein MlaA
MKNNKLFVSCCLVVALTGCATTGTNPIDPWEDWNRDVQSFNDELDEYVLKPVAEGYDWIMPDFAHKGITNFFSNIDDIAVIINDLLQGKLTQTGEDTARFLLNTTLGIGGFVDVAAEVNLPKHDEDFDQTLGVWGVPGTPYIVLPIFGPSSPRGIGGLIADAAMNPINYFTGPFISSGLSVLNLIDRRADALALEKIATEAAIDRYSFFRDSYIAQRKSLVLDGKESKDEDNGFNIDKALDETLKEEKK